VRGSSLSWWPSFGVDSFRNGAVGAGVAVLSGVDSVGNGVCVVRLLSEKLASILCLD